MHLIKSLTKVLVLPPIGPLVLALIGLAIIGRHQRSGRVLAFAGVVVLAALSMPAVAALLAHMLDRPVPLTPGAAREAQAIVILGGGTRLYAPEYGGPTISSITLQRVRYGARIARATGLPVLVSGGAVRGAPPEALLMRDVLVHEFGVPVRWVETRSLDTHENAVDSARILEASGVRRIILVGHSFDFPRSRKEFESAGIAVIAAPIAIPRLLQGELGDFLPSMAGLELSYYVIYEILANALFDMTTGRVMHAPASAGAMVPAARNHG